MKKLLSMTLALVMALSLSTAAFAAETYINAPDTEGLYSGSVTYTTVTQAPTIKVGIPTTAAVTVNPYKMSVMVDGVAVTDQIISPDYYITSSSNVALDIGVTTSATLAGEAELTEKAIDADETDKLVMMYLALQVQGGTQTTPTYTAYNPDSWDEETPGGVMPVTEKAGRNPIVLGTLAKAYDTDASTAVTQYAAFALKGNATLSPEIPWTSADTVAPTVIFSFMPATAAAATP